MAEGQQAGLYHFSFDYCLLGVVQSDSIRTLYCNNDGHTTFGPAIVEGMIWLQSQWGFDGTSHYSYSTDGTRFTDFGASYQLRWGAYRGDRFGLYCFNAQGEHGLVDVDWVRYEYSRSTALPGPQKSADRTSDLPDAGCATDPPNVW